MPLALHAIAEIENQAIHDVGAAETLVNRATRMVRSWTGLQNGGFCNRQQMAFQEA